MEERRVVGSLVAARLPRIYLVKYHTMTEKVTEEGALTAELNDELSRIKFGPSMRDYEKVTVWTVYWAETDIPGFKDEADKIRHFFRDTFHFSVHAFAIPSKRSHLALDTQVNDFLLHFDDPSALLIIHYGGHGDWDDDIHIGQDRQSVWAS